MTRREVLLSRWGFCPEAYRQRSSSAGALGSPPECTGGRVRRRIVRMFTSTLARGVPTQQRVWEPAYEIRLWLAISGGQKHRRLRRSTSLLRPLGSSAGVMLGDGDQVFAGLDHPAGSQSPRGTPMTFSRLRNSSCSTVFSGSPAFSLRSTSSRRAHKPGFSHRMRSRSRP